MTSSTSEITKKKRLYSIIAIVIALPCALASAASHKLIFGLFFGAILALGIDGLFDSFKK